MPTKMLCIAGPQTRRDTDYNDCTAGWTQATFNFRVATAVQSRKRSMDF